MGGSLYLKNGEAPNRSNVCVSGYRNDKPNYALSNFQIDKQGFYAFEDPDLGSITFPSAEHYLHFQKLTAEEKKSQLATWQGLSPSQILAGIRDSKSNIYIDTSNGKGRYSVRNPNTSEPLPFIFNTEAWDQAKIAIQMQINATKYQQSADFRTAIGSAIELGRALDGEGAVTIIEDTSSCKGPRIENEWGTGPLGEGRNILGNSQTAFANIIALKPTLKDSKILPKLTDYGDIAQPNIPIHLEIEQQYKLAENQYRNCFQPTLREIRTAAGSKNAVGQLDTSSLPGVAPCKVLSSTNTAASAPPKKQKHPAQNTLCESLFEKYKEDTASSMTLQQFKDDLREGNKPKWDNCLSNTANPDQRKVAKLFAQYAIKNVMQNLKVETAIDIVKTNQQNQTAAAVSSGALVMKVSFDTKGDAEKFAKLLYEKHGIHSHGLGEYYMKTPQGHNQTIIFLTRDDFNAIAKHSKLSKLPDPGYLAFDSLQPTITPLAASKVAAADDDDDIVPPSSPSFLG